MATGFDGDKALIFGGGEALMMIRIKS